MSRFNLGLFQKRFCSTSRVSGPAINMGATKGRGSTTRMLNWCTEHSANPSLCINQFITVDNTGPSNVQNYSIVIGGVTRYYTTININLENPDTSSVLLCFPGGGEQVNTFISYTEFNLIGSSVIVFRGQSAINTVSFQNAFPWIYNASHSPQGQNDVTFADAVLNTIYGTNIPTNIFLTGKSDGGGFCILYSQLSQYKLNIRAIAPISSAHFGLDSSGNIGVYSLENSQQLFNVNDIIIPNNIIIPGNSVSVFIIHGTGDSVMPYYGQNYISSTAYNRSSNSIWSTIDPSLNEVGGQIISNTYTTDFPSYNSTIQTTNIFLTDQSSDSNTDYSWSSSTNASGNKVLNFITINGQDHDWSGHFNSGPNSNLPPNFYLDATYLLVLFFKLNLGNYKTKIPVVPSNLKAYDGSPL